MREGQVRVQGHLFSIKKRAGLQEKVSVSLEALLSSKYSGFFALTNHGVILNEDRT